MITAKDLVAANFYADEDAAISDALRHLLHARPDLRIGLAVHRYQHGGLSLAQAANLAGVSWPQMRDILHERGILPALGPETLAEANEEVTVLREQLRRSS